MSTITKEFAQDIIKGHGYGVAPSAVEELARIALAAMDGEPVAYMYRDNLHSDARFSLESKIGNWSPEDINEYEISETPLYRHAQQPVVPDRSIFEKWWESQNGAPLDGWDSLRTADGYCDDGIDGQFEAWSAAMLNGGKS